MLSSCLVFFVTYFLLCAACGLHDIVLLTYPQLIPDEYLLATIAQYTGKVIFNFQFSIESFFTHGRVGLSIVLSKG